MPGERHERLRIGGIAQRHGQSGQRVGPVSNGQTAQGPDHRHHPKNQEPEQDQVVPGGYERIAPRLGKVDRERRAVD